MNLPRTDEAGRQLQCHGRSAVLTLLLSAYCDVDFALHADERILGYTIRL